jgi:hypothetical protein
VQKLHIYVLAVIWLFIPKIRNKKRGYSRTRVLSARTPVAGRNLIRVAGTAPFVHRTTRYYSATNNTSQKMTIE